MALSTLKLAVAHLPPAAGEEDRVRRSNLIATSNGAVPPQLKIENAQEPQSLKAISASRRNLILSLTTASLAGVTLFSTEHVDARTMKSENRKRVVEKLKKLREKAGGSKSKTGEADKESLSKLPPPPFYPHKSLNGPLVEAALE